MKANRYQPGGAAPTRQPYLADLLLRDLSVGTLRSLSPLPEDAQRLIDQTVVQVGMDRLVVVDDLISEGLTYTLPDPLGVMELQWDVMNRAGYAIRVMNPAARGENQMQDRLSRRLPIYLTTDNFFLPIRTLRASQRVGAPLDTSGISNATRNVNEAIEDAAINGVDFAVNGNSAPGLINAPNANHFVYETGTAWDNSGKTGEEILADVMGMIDMAQADRRFGPYNLYIPTTYGNKINADFKSNGDKTIRMRLEEIVAGGRNLRIRVADKLPANRTVLVQMTNDVVDIVRGQDPVAVPWTSPDGFTLFWLVMAIMVPRVKDDYDDHSGIVVGFTS